MNRREKIRADLSPLYLSIFDVLCAELSNEWQPYFGFRTLKAQRVLFDRGRSQPGDIITWAMPGESPHNYGCASDWTIFNEGIPLWPKASDPIWKVYEAACLKAGARWGGNFSRKDCIHNELPLSISWKEVGQVFSEQGEVKAKEFIEARLA